MSIYVFPPSAKHRDAFTLWENAFDDEKIKEIIEIGESLNISDAIVGTASPEVWEINHNIRKSSVSWIPLNEKTSWLYDTISYIVRKTNSDCFGFDLYGFVEHLQYTVYNGESEDRYDWHIDVANGGISPRKLSLTLQLSDPSEYEGGQLELFFADTPFQVPKQKGLMCLFPSWTLHRVTPVTKGVRRSLVVWIAGPQFK